MDKGTLTLKGEERTLRKNRNQKRLCCLMMAVLFLIFTALTGCKNQEAQFLIDGFQEAKAEVDAEEAQDRNSRRKLIKRKSILKKNRFGNLRQKLQRFLSRRNQKRVRFMWMFVEQW